jgi:hypothetical protein
MTYLIDKSLEEVVVTLPMLNRYCRDLPLVQAAETCSGTKPKFSENQNPKHHHEGAHARPRDAYLLEMHACNMHACEVHTYEGIRP